MGVRSVARVKNARRRSVNIPRRHVEVAMRGMAEYMAELSTRTPLDELLTEISTIASFCHQLRRATPNRRNKQDFVELANTINWLEEACESAGELLKEYPAFKGSFATGPHSVKLLLRDRNWHRTILNLGGEALSRVKTPGGICVDVRRPNDDGKIVFDDDLLKKHWPAIQVQLRQLQEFDLHKLREVLLDESATVRERLAAEALRNTPTPKGNKSKKRPAHRPPDTDANQDAKFREQWLAWRAKGNPRSVDSFAKDFGYDEAKIRAALDRHRKRPVKQI